MEAKTVIGTAFDLYGTGNDRGVCECTDAGCGNNSTVPSGTVKVHFLDVGQGLSILVQSDGKI